MTDPHVPVIGEGDETPATQESFQHERKRGTIPPGTYDGELRELAIVKRRETGAHVLRLLVRTVDLGRYATAWQGLSENPEDAFDLTPGQFRGLRRFADRLAVENPGTPREIVERLAGLLGERVVVRVARTPVGQSVTVTRGRAALVAEMVVGEVEPGCPAGGLSHSAGECPDCDEQQSNEHRDREIARIRGEQVDVAHRAHAKVIEGLRGVRLSLALVAEGCHDLHTTEGWRALGYESLSEYLAAPEITISRSEFYRMTEIWSAYVLSGGVEPVALQGAGPSKLEVPLPALTAGVVSAEQALADASSMTRKDLRTHYAGLLGDEAEPKPRAKPPVEITDQMIDRATAALIAREPSQHPREVAESILRHALNPNEETP